MENRKPDIYWIELAKAGDQQAFGELMERHLDGVLRFLVKRLGNETDAQDVAQLAFSKAFEKLHVYSPDYAFSTWLYSIATNCSIDFVRQRRNNMVSIDKLIEDEEFNAQSPAPSPEDSLIAEQDMALARELLCRLKPAYRQMVEMRYLQEYAYEEIAQKLNMPIGTVKTQLFRAKEQLVKLVVKHSLRLGSKDNKR